MRTGLGGLQPGQYPDSEHDRTIAVCEFPIEGGAVAVSSVAGEKKGLTSGSRRHFDQRETLCEL